MSFQDKNKSKEAFKLNVMKNSSNVENSDDDIADQFGYTNTIEYTSSNEEVKCIDNCNVYNEDSYRYEVPTLSVIAPIQSRILTVFAESINKNPIHIELDSCASINFCCEKEALKFGFKMTYCKQTSKLGDGLSTIESIGEINEIFYRNNWQVKFRVAVCTSLSAPFIGGTVFMQENGIEQEILTTLLDFFTEQ